MSSPIVRLDTTPKYSEAVVHNGVIYLAGQVPADTTGDAKAQTQSILSGIDALLARAGSDKTRILSATVYLQSFDSFAGMNEAWVEWVPAGHAPARATVGNVTLAKKEWLLEIQITAAVL